MPITTNVFMLAAKKKLRFASPRGQLEVEDLFDIDLRNLDTLAVQLHEAVEGLGNKTFIAVKRRDTDNTALKFEVVKAVIDFRLDEKAALEARAEKSAQKTFLKNLLERKQISALEDLPLEEIQKRLNALDENEVATAADPVSAS